MPAAADRNLLFGILAVQMGFITRDQMIAAMDVWMQDKSKSLGTILLGQEALESSRCDLLDAMVEAHLRQHGNDPQESLVAVSGVGSITKDLERIADPDVQGSIETITQARASSVDAGAVASIVVGTPTSAGLRFRVLRPHAKGGLGEVFVAIDEELHREVALKEIQDRHANDVGSRTRFVLEAEITGGLEHPGIVPVYGLGQYADGRPFYAMRFIRGDSLQAAIKRFHQSEPRLSATGERTQELRKLLGRFIDVCDAIQYAHDRGVLHRDLKPGNIMLGKYGETLVVDWGLAKAVGSRQRAAGRDGEPPASATGDEPALQPASASGSAETIVGTTIGTPQYMSPEQAGGRLDLLGPASDVYSLGATLFALLTGKPPVDAKDAIAVIQKVQKGDILRPRAVKADVDAALEAVCVKAMALRPADRYESPRGLSDDIERWLADNPVSAWPEPWTVRAKRFGRHHQTSVTSIAASLFIGLIALTVGILWYHSVEDRRSREENQRQAEADRKRLLAEAGVRNTLDQAERSLQELHAILARPGGVFSLLNEPARWEAFIQTSHTSLQAAQDLLAGAEDGLDPSLANHAGNLADRLRRDEADRALAAQLEKIRIDRSTWIDVSFDSRRAAAQYPAVFAEAKLGILTDAPTALSARLATSTIKEHLLAALDDWAVVALGLKDWALTEKLLEVSRAAAPDSAWGDRFRRLEVWRDRQALAEVVKEAPIAELSAPLLELVGNLLAGDPPAQASWFRKAQALHPADFWLNLNLANAYDVSNPGEAVAFHRVALGVRPKNPAAYNNLGHALMMQRKFPEAIVALQKAISFDSNHVPAYVNLGDALRCQRKFAEATVMLEKALALAPNESRAYNNLGTVLHSQKKLSEAVAAYKKAIDAEPDHPVSYYNLGNVLLKQNKMDEAIAIQQKALDFDPKFAAAHLGLGAIYYEQKKLPEAIAEFKKCLDLDANNADAWANLGATLYDQKKYPEALAACRSAIERDSEHVHGHLILGACLCEQKKLPEAIAACEKAVKFDSTNAAAYTALALALIKAKRMPEATAAFKKAAELEPQDARGHYHVGTAQLNTKKYPEAVAAFRKAIELAPTYAEGHCNLGHALKLNGDFVSALAAMRQGHALGKQQPAWSYPSEDWIKHCETLVNLDKRLALVLDGKAKAKPNDLLQMASMCQDFQKRYATATKLYRDAFKAQPNLANIRAQQFRYNGARAATLAGTFGDAKNSPTSTDKAALREQDRAWLQADLEAYAKLVNAGKTAMVVQSEERLAQWLADEDLAGVRDAVGLAALPEAEQLPWRKLWADVDQLLKQVRANITETVLKGVLSAEALHQVHDIKMRTGVTYVIDMKSTEFDSFLKLHDSAGKLLAENDDIADDNLDSRIVFTPKQDGVYHITATSFEERGRGAYTLTIRAVAGKK